MNIKVNESGEQKKNNKKITTATTTTIKSTQDTMTLKKIYLSYILFEKHYTLTMLRYEHKQKSYICHSGLMLLIKSALHRCVKY